MTKEEAAARIKVMQAYVDGKDIQVFLEGSKIWAPATSPQFDAKTRYRIKPEKIVGWINIYPSRNSSDFVLHPNKERADKFATYTRIACVKVEYEEGEGL